MISLCEEGVGESMVAFLFLCILDAAVLLASVLVLHEKQTLNEPRTASEQG